MRGAAQAINFTSTADGSDHVVTVAAAVTATWAPATYVLEGYAVNAGLSERKTIFYGTLPVTLNFQVAAGDAPVKTFAQQMVENLETLLLNTSQNNLLETRVGDTMFRYSDRKEMYEDYARWLSKRRNEIDVERAKNGLPSRNRISPTFRITPPGPLLGQPQWFGSFDGGVQT